MPRLAQVAPCGAGVTTGPGSSAMARPPTVTRRRASSTPPTEPRSASAPSARARLAPAAPCGAGAAMPPAGSVMDRLPTDASRNRSERIRGASVRGHVEVLAGGQEKRAIVEPEPGTRRRAGVIGARRAWAGAQGPGGSDRVGGAGEKAHRSRCCVPGDRDALKSHAHPRGRRGRSADGSRRLLVRHGALPARGAPSSAAAVQAEGGPSAARDPEPAVDRRPRLRPRRSPRADDASRAGRARRARRGRGPHRREAARQDEAAVGAHGRRRPRVRIPGRRREGPPLGDRRSVRCRADVGALRPRGGARTGLTGLAGVGTRARPDGPGAHRARGGLVGAAAAARRGRFATSARVSCGWPSGSATTPWR